MGTIKEERILKPRTSKNGYLYVHLRFGNISKYVKIHRLVAEAFVLNEENKPCVNHIDGNKLNNYANNLEWVTISENTIHAMKMGLFTIIRDSNGKIVSTTNKDAQ